MSTESMSNPSSASARLLTGLAALGVLALICYISSIFGPPLHAEYQRRVNAEIKEENRAFCTDLGLSSGSAQYLRCEAGLEGIRAKQEQRTNASQAGVL